MSSVTKPQDLPPTGGYQKIVYQRIPGSRYLNGFQIIAGIAGMTAVSLYIYNLNAKQVQKEEVEMRSSDFAIFPIIYAERDREFLKQLRRNRDEEAKLMANVEGWKVGTWYGEPIYKTLPEDTLVSPIIQEFYAHTDEKSYFNRVNLKLWS